MHVVSCYMAHFHQLLFNVALSLREREEAFGGEAARVVVGARVGDAVAPAGVEHPIVGGLPRLLVVVNVTGPATDVPRVEFPLLGFLLHKIQCELSQAARIFDWQFRR